MRLVALTLVQPNLARRTRRICPDRLCHPRRLDLAHKDPLAAYNVSVTSCPVGRLGVIFATVQVGEDGTVRTRTQRGAAIVLDDEDTVGLYARSVCFDLPGPNVHCMIDARLVPANFGFGR